LLNYWFHLRQAQQSVYLRKWEGSIHNIWKRFQTRTQCKTLQIELRCPRRLHSSTREAAYSFSLWEWERQWLRIRIIHRLYSIFYFQKFTIGNIRVCIRLERNMQRNKSSEFFSRRVQLRNWMQKLWAEFGVLRGDVFTQWLWGCWVRSSANSS